MTRLADRLLCDSSGVTSTGHFVASIALAIAVVLADLPYRIHVIVTLARP